MKLIRMSGLLAQARLCRYAYSSSDNNKCGLTLTGGIIIADLRYCYFKIPKQNNYIMTIVK